MKKGYWVNCYRSVSDEAALKAYAALAGPAILASGGRFLIRSAGQGQFQAFEAGLAMRTVVAEFDSYEIALAARHSDAYQQALAALGSGAERDCRIVEGT